VADEHPRGLTVNAVCLLAALALSLMFAVALLLAAGRAPERGPDMISAPRGPALQLEMAAAAAVPALRPQPLPRRHTVRPAPRHIRPPARRVVTVAVAPTPPPVLPEPTARPTPRPAPPVRRIAPARPIAPAPTAVPKPTATPEPSGEFDTTGAP
jgi:hypothetical protein